MKRYNEVCESKSYIFSKINMTNIANIELPISGYSIICEIQKSSILSHLKYESWYGIIVPGEKPVRKYCTDNIIILNNDEYELINNKIVCIYTELPPVDVLWKELGELQSPDLELINAYISAIHYCESLNKDIYVGDGLMAQINNFANTYTYK